MLFHIILLTINALNIYFLILADQPTTRLLITIVKQNYSEILFTLSLSESHRMPLFVREKRYLHIIQRHWEKPPCSKLPSCFLFKPTRTLITTLAIYLASSVSPTIGSNWYTRHSHYIPEEILGYNDTRLFTLVCNPRGELITLYPRYC